MALLFHCISDREGRVTLAIVAQVITEINPLQIERREESGHPGTVLTSRKIFRLPGATTHSRRVETKREAQEIYFFAGSCINGAHFARNAFRYPVSLCLQVSGQVDDQ